MDFEDVHKALTTLQAIVDKERKDREARVERLSREVSEANARVEEIGGRAELMRQARDTAKADRAQAQDALVAAQAKAAATIATLEAEKEIIAQRDRDSRNEIDRLRMVTK